MELQEIVMATSLVMGLLTCGLVARWYVLPKLAGLSRNAALIPLLLPHAFRYIGLGFLLPGVVASDINPGFAGPAAWGDLAAAGMALLAITALKQGWTSAVPLVWLFTVVGTADLLNAVITGVTTVNAGQFGGMYFVPTLVVPLLLVSHVLIACTLLRALGGVAEDWRPVHTRVAGRRGADAVNGGDGAVCGAARTFSRIERSRLGREAGAERSSLCSRPVRRTTRPVPQ